MRAALGVSWNDAKPRRATALVALFIATLIALAGAIGSNATQQTQSQSLLNDRTSLLTSLLNGNPITGSGATWS